MFRNIRVVRTSLLAMVFAVGLSAAALAAGSDFVGKWKVVDTRGKPFEITLNADRTALGTKKEGLKGTWKEVAKGVEIKWDSGWTTRIEKRGKRYRKEAFKPGASTSGKPTNHSRAIKE